MTALASTTLVFLSTYLPSILPKARTGAMPSDRFQYAQDHPFDKRGAEAARIGNGVRAWSAPPSR